MDQSKTEETKIQIAFELLKGLITDNRYGYKDLKALPELAALMASNLVNAVASTNGGPALPVGTIITVRGNDTEEDDALSHLILTENGWEPCPPRKRPASLSVTGVLNATDLMFQIAREKAKL